MGPHYQVTTVLWSAFRAVAWPVSLCIWRWSEAKTFCAGCCGVQELSGRVGFRSWQVRYRPISHQKQQLSKVGSSATPLPSRPEQRCAHWLASPAWQGQNNGPSPLPSEAKHEPPPNTASPRSCRLETSTCRARSSPPATTAQRQTALRGQLRH